MEIISLNDVAPTPIDSENQDAANNSNPSSQPIDRNEDESFIVKRLIEMLMQATAGTAENSTETAISVDNSTEVAPHTTNPANVLIQQLQSLPHPVIDQLLQLLNVSFSNETTEYEGTTPHAIDNDIDSIESTTVMEKTARSANPEPYFLPVAIFSNSSSGSQVVSSSNTSTPLPNVTASTTSPPTTMTYNRYDAGSDNVKEGYIPDYFVFAVLRNGTIIRKRPNRVVPNVFYMFLEDGTLIQKFPNGSTSVVPLAPVIQVTGFDTREFPASENGNETKSSLVNMTTVEPESTPSSFEIRLGVEDATETVGDVNTTQTTSSSEGSMETTQASTTPLSTTASVKSTTSTSPTTRGEEMTAPPFTNPIESDDGELVITEAVTSPTTLMGNGSTLPLPSGRSIDLSIAGPLLINTTSATTQHLPGNFHLKDEEKRDLLLIESLIKKQQAVLEQLTTLTKLRIENAQPQQSESLAQRVCSI
uniref:Uncharacterized protein n=1 Tax=Photinus pyralis TaxID=7054 RepID=A0A1Y1MD80_PHOPY